MDRNAFKLSKTKLKASINLNEFIMILVYDDFTNFVLFSYEVSQLS